MRNYSIFAFINLSAVLCVSLVISGAAGEKPKPGAAAEKVRAKDGKDKNKPVSPAEKFLLHAEEKLDALTFDAADLATAARFAREAKENGFGVIIAASR